MTLGRARGARNGSLGAHGLGGYGIARAENDDARNHDPGDPRGHAADDGSHEEMLSAIRIAVSRSNAGTETAR